jgi:NADPH:quinone reductase
MPEVGEG